ncbi:MAG: hypothetical protein ABIG28_00705 [archaeon]
MINFVKFIILAREFEETCRKLDANHDGTCPKDWEPIDKIAEMGCEVIPFLVQRDNNINDPRLGRAATRIPWIIRGIRPDYQTLHSIQPVNTPERDKVYHEQVLDWVGANIK